eukprot:2795830-Amphidinium_carterae.1
MTSDKNSSDATCLIRLDAMSVQVLRAVGSWARSLMCHTALRDWHVNPSLKKDQIHQNASEVIVTATARDQCSCSTQALSTSHCGHDPSCCFAGAACA